MRGRTRVRLASGLACFPHAQWRLRGRVCAGLHPRREHDIYVHFQMRVKDHIVFIQVVLDARCACALAQLLVVLVVTATTRIAATAPTNAPLGRLGLHLQYRRHQLLTAWFGDAELYMQVISWNAS